VRRGRVLLPEVRDRPVPRRRTVVRIARRDQRAVRDREEGAPSSNSGRTGKEYGKGRYLPFPGEPLRTGGQLRPGDLTRDPRPDPQVRRGHRRKGRRDRGLGLGHTDTRVPVRGRRGRGHRARRGALRGRGTREARHGGRNLDPGLRRADREAHRRSSRVPVERVQAGRPTAQALEVSRGT
jgi:hypothetical protein